MTTVNDYLNELLYKRSNNYQYTQNEEIAYSYIARLIRDWASTYNNSYFFFGNRINIEMQKSGSKAKGDAIKGKSDIDIFVSITDTSNLHTVKDYYYDLYKFLTPKFNANNIRLQNVSIGLKYAGCDIDITPGKRINQSNYIYRFYDDHNIYSRKNDANTKTNIQKHIDLVRNSGLANEMMLLKIWRNCHGLELPSIAIEIICNEILKNNKTNNLYYNFKTVLEHLRDNITTRRIIDPANTNNNIAESMIQQEKEQIKKTAIQSLNYDYGSTVNISKIVW